MKGKPLDKTVNLEEIARRSPGFSGADLANLMNEAAILAARRNKRSVSMDEFAEALDRVMAGPARKSRLITDAEKQIIAYHEGGHAVVGRILEKCDPVSKVTIISRGMALGYTMNLPTEDRYLQSKSEFEDKIAAMLGGNVAEQLVFGDTTTGASNDIEKATELARKMVTRFGMSEKLGTVTLGRQDEMIFLGREMSEQKNYSDEVARQIDEEVRAIIDRGASRAREVLIAHRSRLDAFAAKLIAEETVEKYRAMGFDIHYIHRTDRTGFKAGALDYENDAAAELNQVNDQLIEFRLKDGLTFQGGYGDLTAEDVKFSFERYRGSAKQTLKDRVAAVETPDPRHVRFRLKELKPERHTKEP